MSDNLGMSTKNVMTLLSFWVAPWLIILIIFLIGYFVGRRNGIIECECHYKGGTMFRSHCIQEVK